MAGDFFPIDFSNLQASSDAREPHVPPIASHNPSFQGADSYSPEPGMATHAAQAPKDGGSSELSSKVGLLSVNAPNAEPHYFGTSSALALSRIVNSALKRVQWTSPTSSKAHSTSRPYDPVLATPCPLPSADGREWLSRMYFEQVHPQYPFLHEPTFRDWEASLLRCADAGGLTVASPVSSFFVNMVSRCPPNPAWAPIEFAHRQVYALGRLMLPWSAPYSSEASLKSRLLFHTSELSVPIAFFRRCSTQS